MNPDTYIEKSQKPAMRLHFKNGDEHVYEADKLHRPPTQKTEAICKNTSDGKIIFEDRLQIHPNEKRTVIFAELYYDDTKVSERVIPEVVVGGDTHSLRLTWNFSITR